MVAQKHTSEFALHFTVVGSTFPLSNSHFLYLSGCFVFLLYFYLQHFLFKIFIINIPLSL
jgi:hypothetical protein